ncbi:KTSC domain-containing protein [Antarcticibacterium flavum]|uniref:KTSC domain-containing protein n=1 Tax=Antarcticibacterium flavum TaxID=2058175 RepID=A0A5B7X0P6_9FLAO|nr:MULTISPECIES: KTSC domain-containing protein [Antarcticibacterium]MCM4158907.1 molecular chaperone DnaJ [Antarcticibacterium sp. W02-3]QCY68163.1 KTSC domain-containing protein [Antarcticibacterium flavum]
MKRINEYKKLFNVEKEIDLKELKTSYRNLVKEWHPDKFQETDELHAEAEMRSKQIIDGYHFLVSIAPATKAANLEEYNITLATAAIADLQHKGNVLEVTFNNGSTYEYFGVNKALFTKLLQADRQFRFAKRNIFTSFLYRKSKKDMEMQPA